MTFPSVSICLPTFNGSRYVDATLASALAQTYPDFELLVVDDASTDDTLGVVAAFRDPRIRVHANAYHLGIPRNWNRCLAHARAPYLLFLFQDDTLSPTALQSLVGALASHSAASLAFGRRAILEDAMTAASAPFLMGRYREILDSFYRRCPTEVRGVDLVAQALGARESLTVNVIGEPSFVLIRRSKMLEVGGYDPVFAQLADWDLWLRLGRVGTMIFVDEDLGTFRVHGGSQSAANHRRLRTRYEFVRLLNRIRRQYGPALPHEVRSQLVREEWQYLKHLVGETLRRVARRPRTAHGEAGP